MGEIIKAKEPFRFYTRLNLLELTGLRAGTIGQLLNLIKKVPESSIYTHTHRAVQQYHYLAPEPPNDFVYWLNEVLGESILGERLASIDTVCFSNIRSLREEIVATIEAYLKNNLRAKFKFAREDQEFYFIKSTSFILPTEYIVNDLKEFAEVLKKITLDSIYFHIFEARLRLGKKTNDFSNWIENSVGDKELADKISILDPYLYTLDNLRDRVIQMVEKRILI